MLARVQADKEEGGLSDILDCAFDLGDENMQAYFSPESCDLPAEQEAAPELIERYEGPPVDLDSFMDSVLL